MKGHIRKRGNKYCFVLDTADKEVENGRGQKWFSGFNTEEEAQRELDKKIEELEQGTYVNETKDTVEQFMTKWLDNKKHHVRPGTWKSYSWLVNTHLIPHLGKVKISKLKSRDISDLYNKKLIKKISASSIKKLQSIFKDALDEGVSFGDLKQNVAKVVKSPKGKKEKFEVFNEEQLKIFVDESREERFAIVFELAVSTGMRIGEILGLRWKDVDFEGKRISVRQAYTKAHSGYEFHEPKTSSGERAIALFDNTVEMLKSHKESQEKEKLENKSFYTDFGLVVQSHIGTPVSPRNISRSYYHLIERIQNAKDGNGKEQYAGFPKIRFHDLRHTHATMLLKRGVHPKIVQERLGHSSITITLDTYSHVIPGLQEAALKSLGSLLQ